MDSSGLSGELMPVGGGDSIPLLRSRLIVGRRDDCDIVLDFPAIQPQHCSLELRNGRWIVRDLAGRHDVKVNGKSVHTLIVRPGDLLTIGELSFRISYELRDP